MSYTSESQESSSSCLSVRGRGRQGTVTEAHNLQEFLKTAMHGVLS